MTIDTANAAPDWTTPAEASHFATTPSYAETITYLNRLEAAAPSKIFLETFGTTPEGRPMTVVVANGSGIHTPEAAHAAKVPVILVQAGIHSGEIEGKDAGLMLLRDVLVTSRLPHLLDHVVLVFIPVYNVDGHERASPYNRINQNGPETMGARGQSQYLNLNRDYVKADAPETRAWLRLWQKWKPDFLIDVHTTDGADYQYDLTWYLEDPHKLPTAVSDWQRQAMATVIPAYEKLGHLASIYLEFKDGTDPQKGIANFGSGPRYSTGYAALRNRPALLVETHMLKSYAIRVKATYDLLQLLLEHTAAKANELISANAAADTAVVARAGNLATQVPLTFGPQAVSTEFMLKGFAYTRTRSEISGGTWIQYEPKEPKTYTIPNWDRLEPVISVTPPAAYVVPAQWRRVIGLLDAHGIAYRKLTCAISVHGRGYQIDTPQWDGSPFEGHLMLRQFSLKSVVRDDLLPPGSVVVPLDQSAANVAIELLEPQAPDSLLRWGYLNAVFEAKEYGEPRVVEKLAREMLEKAPSLTAEFAQKLKEEPGFAGDPQRRLEFFYERSPWYAVQQVGHYPVIGIDAATLQTLERDGSLAGQHCADHH